jgi:hypothetical protein
MRFFLFSTSGEMPRRTIWISNTGPVLSFDGVGQPFLAGKKKPAQQCQSGFYCYRALAVFLERPQAEYQIGAEWLLYQNPRYFYTG